MNKYDYTKFVESVRYQSARFNELEGWLNANGERRRMGLEILMELIPFCDTATELVTMLEEHTDRNNADYLIIESADMAMIIKRLRYIAAEEGEK